MRRLRSALPLLLVTSLGAACDNANCNTVAADVGALCLPETIKTNTAATVEVQELCGPGCARPPGCTASFTNGQVVIDFHEDVCGDSATYDCARQSCQQRTTRCRLPALPDGDYTVVAAGSPSRLMRVRPGGQAGCTLAPPDAGP